MEKEVFERKDAEESDGFEDEIVDDTRDGGRAECFADEAGVDFLENVVVEEIRQEIAGETGDGDA